MARYRPAAVRPSTRKRSGASVPPRRRTVGPLRVSLTSSGLIPCRARCSTLSSSHSISTLVHIVETFRMPRHRATPNYYTSRTRPTRLSSRQAHRRSGGRAEMLDTLRDGGRAPLAGAAILTTQCVTEGRFSHLAVLDQEIELLRRKRQLALVAGRLAIDPFQVTDKPKPEVSLSHLAAQVQSRDLEDVRLGHVLMLLQIGGRSPHDQVRHLIGVLLAKEVLSFFVDVRLGSEWLPPKLAEPG